VFRGALPRNTEAEFDAGVCIMSRFYENSAHSQPHF